ncbi:hypothetical protein ECP03018674_3261 [Escherichia coli P0301867.4]|nr:hypothetical protein ECP03018674_3261 [Escherichia coli P0301867.4]ENC89764.1 hypothetical protein ECP030186711_3436 [Escherichia coli P0301867.11]ENG95281.1 hypothetical protein ECP03018673_3443 [Escherichia coli P0301867.3]ENH00745.1 hypothetical protein ECP03018675_3403 [Escherichia coli P0301867.5]
MAEMHTPAHAVLDIKTMSYLYINPCCILSAKWIFELVK